MLIGRLHSIGPDQMRGYADRLVGDHSTNWIGGHGHSLGVLAKTNDPFRVSIERSGPGQSSYELKDQDVTAATLAWLDDFAARRRRGDHTPFCLSIGCLLLHQPMSARPEDYEPLPGKARPAGAAGPESTASLSAQLA